MSKKKRNYDEVSVVKDLNKKKSCTVGNKTISIDENHTDLGNTSWGKIDYLCKVHQYSYIIGKAEKTFKGNSNHPKVREVKQPSYGSKNLGGISLVDMSKQAMKNSSAN